MRTKIIIEAEVDFSMDRIDDLVVVTNAARLAVEEEIGSHFTKPLATSRYEDISDRPKRATRKKVVQRPDGVGRGSFPNGERIEDVILDALSEGNDTAESVARYMLQRGYRPQKGRASMDKAKKSISPAICRLKAGGHVVSVDRGQWALV